MSFSIVLAMAVVGQADPDLLQRLLDTRPPRQPAPVLTQFGIDTFESAVQTGRIGMYPSARTWRDMLLHMGARLNAVQGDEREALALQILAVEPLQNRELARALLRRHRFPASTEVLQVLSGFVGACLYGDEIVKYLTREEQLSTLDEHLPVLFQCAITGRMEMDFASARRRLGAGPIDAAFVQLVRPSGPVRLPDGLPNAPLLTYLEIDANGTARFGEEYVAAVDPPEEVRPGELPSCNGRLFTLFLNADSDDLPALQQAVLARGWEQGCVNQLLKRRLAGFGGSDPHDCGRCGIMTPLEAF